MENAKKPHELKTKFVALVTCLLGWAAVRAEDVPQFRGVGGLGISTEKGLPLTWSEKDHIRWKAVLPGRGLSCPVIGAGRVYVTACTGVEQKRLHILCFDVRTGKQLWERQLWATGTTQSHPKTNMAAPTPLSDGKHVYALFATGDLACLDRDGDLLWYRSLVGDYPTVGNNVGMAASPVLWNDLVIVSMENVGESFAAGVDKHTGTNRWRVERPRGINWTSPLVINNDGQAELLLQGPTDLTAYDPASGKKRWTVTDKSFATIPSPTFGDGLIYAPGGVFLAIRPGNAKQDPQVVWQSKKLSANYSSPLFYEGRVYTLSYKGVVNCADAATGKALWDLRADGNFAASPLVADGKIFLVSEEGATTVIEAGPEAKVLATSALPEKFLATPVASNGALFLRSDKHLYCIGK
jgi:outer membrane protein assembly factor BamB